jgi:hypothetical protein
MTNWLGDDGWLRLLDVQVRLFNLVGDTTWLRGTVIDKVVQAGSHLVVCDLWAENQRGDVTAQGKAEAILPCRGGLRETACSCQGGQTGARRGDEHGL